MARRKLTSFIGNGSKRTFDLGEAPVSGSVFVRRGSAVTAPRQVHAPNIAKLTKFTVSFTPADGELIEVSYIPQQ